MTFDTLKFAGRLEAGGFSTAQARAAAGAFAEATGEQLASKADVASVKADVASVRADLASVKTELVADLRQTEFRLEAKIEVAKADILKWMFGQTLLIIGVVMALLRIGH